MIVAQNLSKRFEKAQALSGFSMRVKKGSIYGLVGANGAGKTTALKHVTGILKPDSGSVEAGGQPVYENEEVKDRISFIPDELYFFNSSSLKGCAKFYSKIYKQWDWDIYESLRHDFGIDD
jgi:ABC-2 type transport system ATP-binding protein